MLFLINFLVALIPKTAFDPNGLLDDLKKALAERALNAEIDHHLANGEAGNSRNGYGKKTVVTDTARIELDVPRDRQSTFKRPDRQVPAAVSWLRRENHLDVRPRHERVADRRDAMTCIARHEGGEPTGYSPFPFLEEQRHGDR